MSDRRAQARAPARRVSTLLHGGPRSARGPCAALLRVVPGPRGARVVARLCVARGLSRGRGDAPRARHCLQRSVHAEKHLRVLQLRLPPRAWLRAKERLGVEAMREAEAEAEIGRAHV